jgi:hypothetical protein
VFWKLTILLAAALQALRDWLRPPASPVWPPVSYFPKYSDLPGQIGSDVRYTAAHCCGCGYRGEILVPQGSPWPLEAEILDSLDCPNCGLQLMVAD